MPLQNLKRAISHRSFSMLRTASKCISLNPIQLIFKVTITVFTNHWPTRMQLIAVMNMNMKMKMKQMRMFLRPHPPALGGIFVYLMPSPRSMSAKPIYRTGWRETTWSVVSFLRIQGNDRATQSNVYWQIKSTLRLTPAVHLISNRVHKVNRKVHKADLKLNKNILAWIL